MMNRREVKTLILRVRGFFGKDLSRQPKLAVSLECLFKINTTFCMAIKYVQPLLELLQASYD